MMGAGNLAPYLIRAHASVRPIRRVMIWNRTPDKAEALAARLDRPGLSVIAINDPAPVACEADIVSCATFASAPILEGAWLRPGCHVDLVGSYTPEGREADSEVLRRAGRLFVDARLSTVGVSGDVIGPLAEGVITEEGITDLFQLARGERLGRRDAQEITVFKSGGGGHEDLAAALFLHERTGVGAEVACTG
jgi:ornithine cyclodeaminase